MLNKIDEAMFRGFLGLPGFQKIADWVHITFARDCFWLAQMSLILYLIFDFIRHVISKPNESSLLSLVLVMIFFGILIRVLDFERKLAKPNMMNNDKYSYRILRLIMLLIFILNVVLACMNQEINVKMALDGFAALHAIIVGSGNFMLVCYLYFSACETLPPGQGKFQKWLESRRNTATA